MDLEQRKGNFKINRETDKKGQDNILNPEDNSGTWKVD